MHGKQIGKERDIIKFADLANTVLMLTQQNTPTMEVEERDSEEAVKTRSNSDKAERESNEGSPKRSSELEELSLDTRSTVPDSMNEPSVDK